MCITLTIPGALGGKRTLKAVPRSSIVWHLLLRHGLPVSALDSFKERTAMTDAQLTTLLGISVETLQRSRAAGSRLNAITSDRLYRAARIVALAAEVLEDDVCGLEWMGRAQIGLRSMVPLSLMTTDAGCQEVERLLCRMEHGVIS